MIDDLHAKEQLFVLLDENERIWRRQAEDKEDAQVSHPCHRFFW